MKTKYIYTQAEIDDEFIGKHGTWKRFKFEVKLKLDVMLTKFIKYIKSIFVTEIKLVDSSYHDLPEYKTKGSVGMDLTAFISDSFIDKLRKDTATKFGNFTCGNTDGKNFVSISSGTRILIPTGNKIALPRNYEAQIRPRSGLALKHGVTVINTPGTIDSDYRGDIGVILINHGDKPFTIVDGDRIAQIVINKVKKVKWKQVWELDETKRGDGGYGHTGKK